LLIILPFAALFTVSVLYGWVTNRLNLSELDHLRLAEKRLRRSSKRTQRKIRRLGKKACRRARAKRRKGIIYQPGQRDLAPHIMFGAILAGMGALILVMTVVSHR
jgi:hypothetical protein